MYREWCNLLQEEFLKRIYRRTEFPAKLGRLLVHYTKTLFKPLVYERKAFRIHARFYFFKERLLQGETIHFSSQQDSQVGLAGRLERRKRAHQHQQHPQKLEVRGRGGCAGMGRARA